MNRNEYIEKCKKQLSIGQYFLPKGHKCYERFPSRRPIVSSFNCIPAGLSEYVDSFLKYQAKTCKYILGTPQAFY